jgi:hypothetical protein
MAVSAATAFTVIVLNLHHTNPKFARMGAMVNGGQNARAHTRADEHGSIALVAVVSVHDTTESSHTPTALRQCIAVRLGRHY